jgi:hypothetical protein
MSDPAAKNGTIDFFTSSRRNVAPSETTSLHPDFLDGPEEGQTEGLLTQ